MVMKQIVWGIGLIVVCMSMLISPISLSFADEFDDFFAELLQDGYFTLSLTEIASNYVTVWFPNQITNGQPVSTYKVILSTKTLVGSDFGALSGQLFTGVVPINGSVSLTVKDLDATTKYFMTVVALNASGSMIDSWFSNELSFVIADEQKKSVITTPTVSAPTTPPPPPPTTQTNNAWGSDMKQALSNVSPVQNGSTVRINYTPNGNASTVDFSVRHSSEANYRSIGRVPLNQWYVEFTVSKGGTYFVKAVPLDVNGALYGVEIIQELQLQPPTWTTPSDTTTTTVTTTQINVTDKTWPAENMMLVLLLGAVWYGWYRKKAKAHH